MHIMCTFSLVFMSFIWPENQLVGNALEHVWSKSVRETRPGQEHNGLIYVMAVITVEPDIRRRTAPEALSCHPCAAG